MIVGPRRRPRGLRLHRGLVAAFSVALALTLAGPTLAANRTVEIQSFDFRPDPIKIRVGDSITWVNNDPVPHTATARDGSFDTRLFLGGKSSDAIVFARAGTFAYFCATHPEMTGSVIVAAGTAPATDTGPGREASSIGVPAGLAAALAAIAAIAVGAWVYRLQGSRRRDAERIEETPN